MRFFILTAGLVLASGFAQADDFGQRFADSQPSALEDVDPQPELSVEDLQNIEPAAGDETDTQEQEVAPGLTTADGELILSP